MNSLNHRTGLNLIITETKTYNVKRIAVKIERVEIFESVISIVAELYDENDVVVSLRRYTLEGNDYTNWRTGNDNYLMNYVVTQLEGEVA